MRATVVLAVALVACGGTDDTADGGDRTDAGTDGGVFTDAGDDDLGDLTVDGTDFAAHDGRQVFVALVRSTNGQVDDVRSAVIADGAFTIVFPDALTAGRSYRLDTFADVDGDGRCDPAVDDAARTELGALTGDVRVELEPTTETAAACDSFARHDLTFKGEGFDPHDGRAMHVALVNTHSGRTVATESARVAAGDFEVQFRGRLGRAATYRVDHFVDLDDDLVCEAPDPDRAWRTDVGTVQRSMTLTTLHSHAYTSEACEAFAD